MAAPICPHPRASSTTSRSPRRTGGGADLPAPKGFFDDLPQPAKGGGNKPDLPAPKGFFDDLPQPAKGGGSKPDLPAPKGFFDDLPAAREAAQRPDLPAPKGFFDDLPQPAGEAADNASTIRELSSADLFTPPAGTELDLGPSLSGDEAARAGDSAGTLDLEPGSFKDLELAEPVKPEPKSEGPIKFKKPDPVDAEDARRAGGDAEEGRAARARARGRAAQGQEAAGQARAEAPEGRAEQSTVEAAKKKKHAEGARRACSASRSLGSGGVYLFQRHAAAQRKARRDQLEAVDRAHRARRCGREPLAEGRDGRAARSSSSTATTPAALRPRRRGADRGRARQRRQRPAADPAGPRS